MELDTLRIANINRNKEFAKDISFSLSFIGNELAGETGELCNLIKKMERAYLKGNSCPVTKQELIDEIADVLICLDLLAMDLRIDISNAVVEKFNRKSDEWNLKTKLNK